ncbi:hypothetical protein D3C78_379690 [compost metagenome]
MYRLPIHLIDLTDSKDSARPKEILTLVFLREKSTRGNSSLQIKNKNQVKTLSHAISATFLLKTWIPRIEMSNQVKKRK